MTKENKDSKKEEVETPSDKSTEEKQPAEIKEEDTSQKDESKEKTLEEQLAEERELRENAEKKASDFEKAFHKEKGLRKGLEIEPNNSQTDVDEVDSKVQQALTKERVKSTFEEFVKDTPDLHEANDLDGSKYSRFKDAVEKKLGAVDTSNSKSIKDAFELIFHQEFGTSPTQKDQSSGSEDEVVDSGIGDSPASLKKGEDKPDTLTRPLTEIEKQAVKDYALGKRMAEEEAEKEWREKKAKLEKERQGNQ
uniref:Uncharacterized protein n=1 Tax=viral metagenome TaxID=1070528 RepID=A0A6H1ZKJ7_9ZZZZ